MTVLSIHPDQIQSTSLLKSYRLSITQTAQKVFLLNRETDTHKSKEIVFVVHPVTRKLTEVDPDQLWFWSAEWQGGERQVEADLLDGEYDDFDNMDDFFADM